MNQKNTHLKTSFLLLVIIGTAMVRIINTSSHEALCNFTPIGSMALIGGKYFSEKWKAYLFPFLTLWISDLVLNYLVFYHEWRWFYEGFYWTYGSFALIVLIGSMIKKPNIKNILLASLAAALVHYIISDFGVWLEGTMYPKTMSGLAACYVAALPYLKFTLAANIVFSFITFGIIEWAGQKFPSLKSSVS